MSWYRLNRKINLFLFGLLMFFHYICTYINTSTFNTFIYE